MRRRLVLATVVAGVMTTAALPSTASAQIFSGVLILPCNQPIVGMTILNEEPIPATMNKALNASLNASLNPSLNQPTLGIDPVVRRFCHFLPAVQ